MYHILYVLESQTEFHRFHVDSHIKENVFTGGSYQDPQDAETNHQCSASNRTGGYPEKYVSS
jgi:hypothetical protein